MGSLGKNVFKATGVGTVMSALGDMFKPPAAPTTAPTPVMPVADDAAATAARRKRQADMAARQGRASTILTQDNGITNSQTLG